MFFFLFSKTGIRTAAPATFDSSECKSRLRRSRSARLCCHSSRNCSCLALVHYCVATCDNESALPESGEASKPPRTLWLWATARFTDIDSNRSSLRQVPTVDCHGTATPARARLGDNPSERDRQGKPLSQRSLSLGRFAHSRSRARPVPLRLG